MTLMMAITEGTVVAGIMTFFLYGVLPTLVILYIGGSGQRRQRREQETREKLAAMQAQPQQSQPPRTADPEKLALAAPPEQPASSVPTNPDQ